MEQSTLLSIAGAVAYYALWAFIFIRIALENKNPLKTQSYLLLIALFPIIGLFIYFIFGVNFRKRKLFSRKAFTDQQQIKAYMDWYEDTLMANEAGAREALGIKSKLAFLSWRNNRSAVTMPNEVRILRNGEEKFPVLFEELKKAQHFIHLEYYIIEEGSILDTLKAILIAKAKEGLQVRLIYDAVGCDGFRRKSIRELEEAGVEIGVYNPVRFVQFARRLNYRDHRKIVIIDGKVGFVGGINISNRYLNDENSPGYWRDTHCMIQGQAVSGLQIHFILNWYFVKGELLKPSKDLFPPTEVRETLPTLILGGAPDNDSENLMEAYFGMFAYAQKEVLVATPYFIPNSSIMTALKTTAKSGVKVKMMFPASSDVPFVHNAGFTYIEELLENDVEVYLYEKGMLHAKVIIVDEELATVGTANMDYRSFDQNAEINAFFFDKGIADKLRHDYLEDLKDCRKVELESWRKRPLFGRILGSVARLVAPLL